MEILNVILMSLFSVSVLFVLAKLNGNKQMSELTMFDYIIGISIGSIAAEMATDLDNPERPLTAMVTYAFISLICSILSLKSLKIRRIISGKSIILFKDGHFYRGNLKKSHIDISEFLMQSRTNGYFDLSQIKIAVLEPTGKISFMPKSSGRPVTASDLKIITNADEVPVSVILDGKILNRNLYQTGKDENWLKNELEVMGFKKAEDIFLATLTSVGVLKVFISEGSTSKNDIFGS